MVVARKTPVAPASSSSRSSSSQQPTKPVKSKTPPVPVASSNGKAVVPPKKSKSPLKKDQKQVKSTSHFRWFLLLSSVFVFYTVTTCPSNFPRTSTVCHSLDLYKTHIVDPYLVPPIKTFLHHADPYITPVKPYASSATEFTRTHVVPRASALLDSTLKQYDTHVAPRLYWFFVDQYWNGIIKPIYYKGLHTHLEQHSRPYRIYYRRFIVPGAKKAVAHANATYIRFRPHAEHYLSEAWRHTINAYEKMRPHVIRSYRRVRPHAIVLLEKVKFHALILASKAGDARRQYVDPHVLRIWEKVSEPSNTASYSQHATSLPKPTQAAEDKPTPSSFSSIVVEPVNPTTEPTIATELVDEPEPEQEAEPEATVSQEETAAPEPTITPEPSSSSEADIPPPSAPVHATPVPAAEHEAESAASVVAASLHAAAAAQVTPEPESHHKFEPESEPDIEESRSTEDVDDFLKDIGISEDDEIVEEPAGEEQPVEEVETEPERPSYGDPEPSPEERRELTAKKRAAITLRHEKWQADLDALVREKMHGVRASLTESRGAAIAHLAQWGPRQKGVIAEVESEAERLLKGLEGYLKGVEEKANKMKKTGTKQGKEKQEREKEMWNKVVEKVEIRLSEKVRDIHKEVHDWFIGVHEQEIQEINAVIDEVKSLADRAQADLGLDYAWLDDVTYYDWQKYHDLMRTSENFTSQAQKIQAQIEPEGTNELVDALNDLEREVNEVVEGFDVLIANVRRRAEGDDGVFGADADTVELDSQTKAEGVKEPKVSVLPIEPEKVAPVPVEDTLVGRGKEEVEAKLAGVPVEDLRAGREEL